ncbi:hypothetical protein AMTRI_Chr06g197230 [Amborella trichopoda]
MAAYRQRERDALLLQQLERESDKEREAMPKPRGFNCCCIAAITSIAIREGGPRRERGRSAKRERIGERAAKRERTAKRERI